MLPQSIREKLKDDRYLRGHLAAVAALRGVKSAPWYDSAFLRYFETAKLYLRQVKPEVLNDFGAGFDPLRPPMNFQTVELNDLFDEAKRSQIKQIAVKASDAQFERHEEQDFGRQILRDDPISDVVQNELLPMVSELAGRELTANYNFLCLYGENGQCELHMDEPRSMYTLDYCIDTNVEWPIHLSNPVDWPSVDQMEMWEVDDVMRDDAIQFSPFVSRPNSALFFTGSSQWHYRSSIPKGGYCHLLFFHFCPAGLEDLVRPAHWHLHFDLPELEPLCDLFDQGYRTVYQERDKTDANEH